jgi:hypothetical protein
MPRVKVRIRKGTVTVEGEGFVGKGCEILKEFARSGRITDIHYHAEYYQTPILKEDVSILNGDEKK